MPNPNPLKVPLLSKPLLSTRADAQADDPPHVAALREAVRICGGQKALAAGMRKHPNCPQTVARVTVNHWLKHAVLIDEIYWQPIEAATDMAVTRRKLRPDLYPKG